MAQLNASLLNAGETTLKSVEQLQFDEDLAVAASSGEVRTDRPMWPLLALLAFAVLLGEWWYYNRGAGPR